MHRDLPEDSTLRIAVDLNSFLGVEKVDRGCSECCMEGDLNAGGVGVVGLSERFDKDVGILGRLSGASEGWDVGPSFSRKGAASCNIRPPLTLLPSSCLSEASPLGICFLLLGANLRSASMRFLLRLPYLRTMT